MFKRRIVLSVAAVLGAVLIAILSSGVIASCLLSQGYGGYGVALAQLSLWSAGSGFIYPTTTSNSVIVGANSVANADHILDVSGAATFNEQGSASDFRVEGDTNANLFCTNGTTDRVGIGTSTPSYFFSVTSGTEQTLGGLTGTDFAFYNIDDEGSETHTLFACGAEGKDTLSFGSPASFDYGHIEYDVASTNMTISNADKLELDNANTQFDGGQTVNYVNVTSTYSIGLSDYFLSCNPSSNFDITLPSAATAGAGKCFVIKNRASGNTATVKVQSGEKLNGTTNGSLGLTTQKSVTVVSGGTDNWEIIATT